MQGGEKIRGEKKREIKQVPSAVTIIYLEAAGWNSFLKYILIANYGSCRRVASVRIAPPQRNH